MTDTPLISVIIPVFNSTFVESSIQSCLQQSLDGRGMEIIVVDDASTDDTVDRVKSLDINIVQLVELKTNGGPAKARNAGMKAARGKYIAFLDSDDLMQAEKLEQQLNFLDKHPTYKAVISGLEEIDEQGESLRTLIRDYPEDTQGQTQIIFLDDLHTITSTLLFERELLSKTGPMDESLINLEDMEFVLRLLTQTAIHYLPKALTIRRVLATGLSQSVSEDLFIGSRQAFFSKAQSIHPELQKLGDLYWSLNYARLGRVLQRQGHGSRSRMYYQKSLAHRFNLIGVMGYLLTHLPVTIQATLANKTWKKR